MFELFMKQVKVDGSGKFTVCRLVAETEEALSVKHDFYQGDDWQDATEAEYHAQFAERTAPVESAEDEALGKSVQESEEKLPEQESAAT